MIGSGHEMPRRPAMKTSVCRLLALGLPALLIAGCASVKPQSAVTPSSSPGNKTDLLYELRSTNLATVDDDHSTVASRLPISRARLSDLKLLELPPRRSDQLRIHVLPVGTGSCHVVECPGSNADPLLFDCGSRGGSQLSLYEARDYIQAVVGDRRPNVVVSHPDADHTNWVPRVIDPHQVRSLWIGDTYANHSESFLAWTLAIQSSGRQDSSVYEELPENWHNDRAPVRDLSCGVADTYVLGVNNGADTNSRSLMLSIQHGEFSVTFTGDATFESESAAITNFADSLRSTVLLASHHGASSEGSNHEEWIKQTHPNYVVYSAGSNAGYGHPRCDVVDRYRSLGALLPTDAHPVQCGLGRVWKSYDSLVSEYSTHSSGLIVITTSGKLDDVTVHCGLGRC